MKTSNTSNTFNQTIQSYLENRAQTDQLFATKYANAEKNITDCCTYILNTVQKSGCNGFADEEIFGMAVHYYDEENIEVGKPVKARVVINQTVEITEADKVEAKAAAIQKIQDEAYVEMTKKKPVKKEKQVIQSLSLFDYETENSTSI